MADADRAWAQDLLASWRTVARDSLRIDPDPLPTIVFFDDACRWSGIEPAGTPHGGTLRLPDGESMPVRLATFAGVGPGEQPYLVMAMPSLWRAEPRHRDNPDLPRLLRSVFAHEMAHTVQSAGIGAWLGDVEKRLKLPGGLDDDIIQNTFEKDPEFRAGWSAERTLLYQAANESTPSLRRAFLTTALAMMNARRTRYFTGERAVLGELEDLFLNMEGLGQWVGYQVALQGGLSPAEAQAMMRGSRNRWSQDEGLAAFLVIDALVPGWRGRVLKGKPASVYALLQEAAGS